MRKPSENVLKLRTRSQNTRKNFGPAVARKRGESNFMRAFERAWFAKQRAKGLAAGEFSLAGFGVADLVWIGWHPDTNSGDFTALGVERQLRKRHLHAFEGKLNDWRGALKQAFRYRYFADKAIVVIPEANVRVAEENVEAFRHLCVGLWSFDPKSAVIREIYTPTRVRAFSEVAKEKAIRALTSGIDLSKFCE